MSDNKNVYEKLGLCILDLQNFDIKKSGKSKNSRYCYFELCDFLPKINELNNKHRIKSLFSIVDKIAILRIVDIDSTDSVIEFSSHIDECELGGGVQKIQNLGAVHTYMRRYMYVLAYDIVENDIIDQQNLEEKSTKNSSRQIETDPERIAAILIKKQSDEIKKLLKKLHTLDSKKFSFIELTKIIRNNKEGLSECLNSILDENGEDELINGTIPF